MRTDLAADRRPSRADRVKLQQVLMNLMLNGLEAMANLGGELTVSSRLGEDGQLTLAVSDSGVGLPTEEPDRIFATFFSTKPQGTGMGLPISRSIVESHGGVCGRQPTRTRRHLPFDLAGRRTGAALTPREHA